MKFTNGQRLKFRSRTEPQDYGCLLWTGARPGMGPYGGFNHRGKWHSAHRLALLLAGVEIPDGMTVDHLCKNTLCVEVAHLRVVPPIANVRCGRHMNSRICGNGHRRTKENTHHFRGLVFCRDCGREAGEPDHARERAEHERDFPLLALAREIETNGGTEP